MLRYIMRFSLFGIPFTASGRSHEPMNLKDFTKFLFEDGMAYHDVYSVWELSRDRGPGAAERMVENSCSASSALANANGELFALWSASLFPDLEYAPPPGADVQDDGREARPLGAIFFEYNLWMECHNKEGVVINWVGLSPTAIALFIKFGIGARGPDLALQVKELWLGRRDGNQAELIDATIPSIRKATLSRVLELARLGWHAFFGESGEALNRAEVEPIFQYVLTSLTNDDAVGIVGGPRAPPIDAGAAVVHAHHHIGAPRRRAGKIMGFMEFAEKVVVESVELFPNMKNGWEYIRTHRDQEELIVFVFGNYLFTSVLLHVGSPGFQVAIHSLFYSPPSDPPTDQDNQMREWMGSLDTLKVMSSRMNRLYYECVNPTGCDPLRIWLKQSPVAVGALFTFLNDVDDVGVSLSKVLNVIFAERAEPLWHEQDDLRDAPPVGLVRATDAAVHAMEGMRVPLRSDEDLIKVLGSMLVWRTNTVIGG